MSDDRAPGPRPAAHCPAAPGPAVPDLARLRRARAQHLAFQRLLRGLGPAVLILAVVIAEVRGQPHPGSGAGGWWCLRP